MLILGPKPTLITTCYISSGGGEESRWIPAAGGLANASVGLIALLCLRVLKLAAPIWRYFLVLAAAFNLFLAAGYPAYSGVALFGDWAAVISGLQPSWLWRGVLILSAFATYYFSLVLIGRSIRPFLGSDDSQSLQRLRFMTRIPFLTALVVAFLGAIPNPQGWRMVFSAALPSAFASFGLTRLRHYALSSSKNDEPLKSIRRSSIWIAFAMIVLALFIAVLGRGLRLP